MSGNSVRIMITATFRNTVVTACDIYDNCLGWDSTLASGDTSYNIGRRIARILKKLGISDIEVVVKGPGEGKIQVLRAIKDCGLDYRLIKDITPIPHNGCIPPRRLKKRY